MPSLFQQPPPRQRVLRPHQRAAVAAIASNLHNRSLLVAPTGSGKTVMGSALVSELAVPTLWLAHRIELITQAAASLESTGLHVGIIKAGIAPDPSALVQVASIQTLARRAKPEAMLIVIDEAHHATAASYRSILDAYPGVPVVGLTATPFRTDGRGLGDLFNTIIVSAHADELIEQNYLHAPRVFAADPPDLRGVQVRGGDYVLGQLASRMTPDMTGNVVSTWQARSAGRRTVAFACDVDHSRTITRAFCDAGIAAEHIDRSTPANERREILERLASGQTHIVSNCMVLTEGWDLPSLECAIICRPTASLNLHLQMIGRVMRAVEGKSGAIVLDHAGNHHMHGLVTRRLSYSLDGSVKCGESEPLGLRQCRNCFLLYESKLPACPECGHVPTPFERVAGAIGSGSGELGEFVEDFDYRKKIWNLIEAEREAMDFKPGWSLFRYADRFGCRPCVAEINGVRELVDEKNATIEEKRAVFAGLMKIVEDRGMNPGWASHKYKEMFGVWPRGFVGDVRDRSEISERWAARMGVGK